VFALSGKPQSEWHAEHAFGARRHEARLVGVARSSDEMDRRIAERTRRWLSSGWVDEVRALIARGYGETRAMGSVGFRQIHAHLAGELRRDELEVAIVRATRIFARRQRTWLREQPVTWVR
jgi:tRNA dimethylallyltransferase